MSSSDAGGAPGPGGGGGGGAGPNVVVSTASGSGVAAKITHVKTTSIDGSGGIGIGTIMTSGGISNSSVGGIKVATSGIGPTIGATPIALNASQTGTAFRAIGAGGQSTQVRVVMPPGTLMPQSMIKHLEGAAAAAASGRTQITAIAAAGARTVSNTSITVTRPVTQTTYLPRAGVTATHMTGMGGQRLVTPIRATPAAVNGAATVAGLTAAGSFVRGTAVNRNTSSPATTVISPATSTTWMAANTTGQVQLIRAISHQPRPRLITTQGISSVGGSSTATSGTVVATTATLAQGGGVVMGSQQQQQQQAHTAVVNQASMQAVSSHQQQHQQQQAYVATLATVLPPRQQQQQTATLVYSSNVSTSQSQAQTHQFNSTVGGQRFAVATPISAGPGGTGSTARQIRPIQLPKSFSAAKLNTTSISIRSPNLPQLTPTTNGTAAANSPRSNTISGASSGATGNVIPTTNLSTTRIIQLQQQPGNSTQQIIGSTGRLASNVMLQPIIVNASAGGKIGIRPSVSMATKVQPSLTITQLGIGKLPGSTGTVGSMQQQQNLTASIQTIGNSNNSGGGNASPSICTVNTNLNSANLVNVSQAQLLTTQNVVSSAGGATVVPLAITTRGGAGGNILTGTITPIKNTSGITVGKVMAQAQVHSNNIGQSDGQQTGATSVFIHHAATPQRPHSGGGVGSGSSVSVATSNVITSGPSSVITASGNTTGAGGPSTPGAFLPAGSTFYYESVPASSVQVSTGVLSLATTTVTSSTLSQQQQIVANSAANLPAITSLPYAVSHAPSSTATFTVVPSSGVRTIGQLQLPISSGAGAAGGTQIQAVPVRFSAQLASTTADGTHIAVGQPTQLVASSSGQQILIPPPQQQSITTTGHHPQAPQQHMVIPLQTSIKVTSAGVGNNASSSAVVSNFLRKRDVEGSLTRVAKNLAPTFLSMNSTAAVTGPSATAQLTLQTSSSAAGSFSSNTISNSANAAATLSSTMNVEGMHKKERVATVGSTRSSRAVSPASSDGSTTVSANSSPGIEQQIQDSNMVLNHQRMSSGASEATHFNPINELYSNHHSAHASGAQHQHAETPSSSRNSSLENQPHASYQQLLQSSGVIDYPPRKKSRRSTNDSQQSTQSQASLSLPPPTGGGGNNIIHHGGVPYNAHSATGNGPLMVTAGSSYELNNVTSASSHKVAPHNQMTASYAADFKENTKPVEYILRKPRSCTMLNSYKQNWKAANNHFQRYSDIKPREDRRPTIIDLANQANVMGKINGWKIHHLCSQIEDLVENESSSYDKLTTMLKQMEMHEMNPDFERISELLKGNIQRSKIIIDGVNEAQNQIMKIFEHKTHISDIITRCASKRNFKKRDKV